MEVVSTVAERPVFDVANDNETFWLPAFVEEAEEDEPEWRSQDDNNPRMAFRGEWIGDTFWPDQEFHKLLPEEVAQKEKVSTKGARRQKTRIAKRQSIGDPSCAANDNQAWPLLSTLCRDGASGSADLVIRYRALVALSQVEPLQAQDVSPAGDLRPDRKSKKLDVTDVDEAAAKGFSDTKVKGGEIRQKEVRRSKGGTFDIPLKRKGAADTETGAARSIPTSFRFTDAVLIASLDAKPILAELRAAIGPLLDAFEDAVLGGLTLAQIGIATGAKVKPEIAGRALVMTAIDVLRDTWRVIAVRERKLAQAAERNVERKRRQIAERRATYLGLAA